MILVLDHRFIHLASFCSPAFASSRICAESRSKNASASGFSLLRSSTVFFAKMSSSDGARSGGGVGAGGGGGGGAGVVGGGAGAGAGAGGGVGFFFAHALTPTKATI